MKRLRCLHQALEELQLSKWPNLSSSLLVLHTLYLNGSRFPSTFSIEHAQDYANMMNTLRKAIEHLAKSQEVHSLDKFQLLPEQATNAWALVELMLRSCVFFEIKNIIFLLF